MNSPSSDLMELAEAEILAKLSVAQRLVLASLRPAGFGHHMGSERHGCLASCAAMQKQGLIEKAEDHNGPDAFVNGRRLFVRLTARGRAAVRSLAEGVK